jgi:hypothetical protein
MTAEEHFEEIAKTLNMGVVPDAWNLMARHVIVRHLEDYARERVQEALEL